MIDPIGSFEIIKENFIRYIKTAFGTKFEGVEKERYDLLNYDKVLYRMPWIEPLTDYVSSNKRIIDLSVADLGNALTVAELNIFQGLVQTGLFPSNGELHSHQAEMLKSAMEGHNCIITSGTGSGKTESFLLPLFAQLSKELAGWGMQGLRPASVETWWRDRGNGGLTPNQIVNAASFTFSDNVQQRKHETRPAGVRALILYPMNALVEDQMSRLRKSLDSDDTRSWLAANADGNAISFGRYNGSSPVAGELKKIREDGTYSINTKKVNQLKDQLLQVETDAHRVDQYILSNPQLTQSEKKDLKSFFQRLDGSEMRCRFDMQVSPPDILITNYSMLSIMLMRMVDSSIFDLTRSWLACEDLPTDVRECGRNNRIFHLIIDELHLYRGTQGTEVAYLLRLVLNRLGLHPNHPQFRILASSASLEPGGVDSIRFLQDFFGVDNALKPFKIIEGRINLVSPVLSGNRKLPVNAFKEIAEAYTLSNNDIQSRVFIDACEATAIQLESLFDIVQQGQGIKRLLCLLLNPAFQLKERMYSPCEVTNNGNVTYKAICSVQTDGDYGRHKYYANEAFEHTENRDDLQKALRGLLISRALLDERAYEDLNGSIARERKLPRFRFHYFFRNIEGIWASVKSDDIDSPAYSDRERTVGKLYPTTRINSERGNRVLELLYCDNCGTTLFGGSRLVTRNESGQHSFELLPISPNIEGIPEKTPAKLVEKRSFQEYAIFWPIGSQEHTRHDAEPGISANFWRQTSVNGVNQTDYEAKWIPASLNCISGDIDFSHDNANANGSRWIKGYYFTVTPNGSGRDIALPDASGNINISETHRALPNVCPCCGLNNQKRRNDSRKIKTTSIRGFRTGFAKTTQIFAKELMYQLPAKEADRKLIVFSDSREDAAQIANGIERNHFTDLLREILVNELHARVLIKHEILSAIEANDTARIDSYRTKYNDQYSEVEGLITLSCLQGTNPLIIEQRTHSSNQLVKLRQRIFSVREMVDLTNSLNLAPLIKHFIQLGINPGGNDINIQERLLNSSYVPWFKLMNFNNLQWVPGADPTFINDLKEGTFDNLATMFFGTLFYSFESSGLGFVCMNPQLDIIDDQARILAFDRRQFLQIVNSTIRILGDKFKHNKIDDGIPFNITRYREFPTQAKKYIRAVAGRLAKTETELGEAVFTSLLASGIFTFDSGIQIENLYIEVAKGSDPVWTSTRGRRPHLHLSGGICTYSATSLNLQPDKTCNDIWVNNYLSYNALIKHRDPIRLHCEELTGQTDDQFERQRHFRNVILPDEGNKTVKTIDLLSVTTTLEVGVDIGVLQAVMLGNMPPQRFNYQQRVGRAGRRGQAYSVILTFCRGRSHDEFYFSNPHKITGDPPPTPFLTMGRERIFKRLLAKEVFRRAYIHEGIDITTDEKSSVHGEFGNIGDSQVNWLSYKSQIVSWINNNLNTVHEIVDSLLTPELLPRCNGLIDWINDTLSPTGLIGKSQTVIDNEEIATTDISEKLAEGGILPMFGMPTTVKNLYHGIKPNLQPVSIDRPQSMAIYEFAPGAQKTKDKAIQQVIGFTSDLINTWMRGVETVTNTSTNNNLPFSLNRWYIRCRSCGFFETYSEDTKASLDSQNYFDACPSCMEVSSDKYQRPVKLKGPRAYRTNFSPGSDQKDDSEFLLSRPPIFAEKVNDPANPDLNQIYNNTQLTLSDKDVTWRVNTNSDRFFTGRLYNTNNRFPFSPVTGFWFNDQWLANDFANNFNENGYAMTTARNLNGQDEQIALASNKKTEILRISPTSVPVVLDLNMFSRETDSAHIKAQTNGVRSAYYSAAFLLQRILADKLDIDPAEIEIADISMKAVNDGTNRQIAEIILTDELPNGSGFVRYLYENFQQVLNEALNPPNSNDYLGKIHSHTHSDNCADACYECLKVFRNMNYHSLLDWRLGLAMIRIMADASFKCGTDGQFDQYLELSGWLGFATRLRNMFGESFGYSHLEEINGLPIIKWGPRDKNVIVIIHPFWNYGDTTNSDWLINIKTEIQHYLSNSNGTCSIIDTFNLHRRPGWCYEKLVIRQ